MATIGEQLLQPENGMKRLFICNNESFFDMFNMSRHNASEGSDGNDIYWSDTRNSLSKVIFFCYTKKLNILSPTTRDGSNLITVKINDTYTLEASQYSGTMKKLTLNQTYENKKAEMMKVEISSSNNYLYADCIDINEDGYLLTEEEYIKRISCHYLIKDDNTNKIYGYDENNNELLEVSDSNILKDESQYDKCINDLTKVKDLIDLTSNNIIILSDKNSKLIVDGIKSNKELIISNQNLSIVNAETVHSFLFEVTKITNGNCKFVISADNGQTWLSWNGSSWDTLINTTPLDNNKIKQYSKLSDSEKIQWNKLKDEIWTSGMETDITNVDYNSILTNKTIRFAFVLYRPTYDDNISIKDTQWLFDKIGSWHKLSEDDIDIAINSNMCTVTPKLQNLTNVKVNILL